MEDCKHSIESEALTVWMNQNDEEICLKQCPLCKTPILKTQRFMNQVKVILEDVSKIKIIQYGELTIIRNQMKTMLDSLKYLNKHFSFNYIGCRFSNSRRLWDTFCKPLLGHMGNKRTKFTLPANDIESLNFVIDLFNTTSKFKNRIKEINNLQRKQIIINHFDWILTVAFTYAQQLSNQQKSDISIEMARGSRFIRLFEIMSDTKFQMAVNMQTSDTYEIKKIVDNMEVLLMSCNKYTLSKDQEIQNLIEEIQQKINGLPLITNEEKQMIHAAMSTNFIGGIKAQGHWCKCPNGHIYCITECGGPMQQSICPDCKVPIGGQSHRHVSGITVASEMDGARNLLFQQ